MRPNFNICLNTGAPRRQGGGAAARLCSTEQEVSVGAQEKKKSTLETFKYGEKATNQFTEKNNTNSGNLGKFCLTTSCPAIAAFQLLSASAAAFPAPSQWVPVALLIPQRRRWDGVVRGVLGVGNA